MKKKETKMKIETRLDIGQRVFVPKVNEVVEAKVDAITVRESSRGQKIVKYHLAPVNADEFMEDVSTLFSGSQLFLTRKDAAQFVLRAMGIIFDAEIERDNNQDEGKDDE